MVHERMLMRNNTSEVTTTCSDCYSCFSCVNMWGCLCTLIAVAILVPYSGTGLVTRPSLSSVFEVLQIQRGKVWNSGQWSCVLMSGRQRVDTRGVVPKCNNSLGGLCKYELVGAF